VQITRSQAVRIFDSLGHEGSGEWKRSKMIKQLSMLHRSVGEDQVIGDNELDNLLDELIHAGKVGEPIEVEVGDRVTLSEEQRKALVEKWQQAFSPELSKEKPKLVRPTRGRYFTAGKLFRKLGIDGGISEAMLAVLAEESKKPNTQQDLAALKNAWQTLNGYLYGDSGLDWETRILEE